MSKNQKQHNRWKNKNFIYHFNQHFAIGPLLHSSRICKAGGKENESILSTSSLASRNIAKLSGVITP